MTTITNQHIRQTDVPSSGRVERLDRMAADLFLNNSVSLLQPYQDEALIQHRCTVQKRAQCALSEVEHQLQQAKLPQHVYVCTVGSNAKLENCNRIESPMEFVVISKRHLHEQTTKAIERLKTDGSNIVIAKRVECKDEQESLIRSNITGKCNPSRLLHHIPFVATGEQQIQLISRFVFEIRHMSGKDRRKFKRDFVNPSMRNLEKVIAGKDNKTVDLEQGVLSYTGHYSGRATKYSLLRAIQYGTDFMLVEYLQKGSMSYEMCCSLIRQIPRSTRSYIQYIHDHKLNPQFTKQDSQDLAAAYSLGLFYYHLAQLTYTGMKRPVTFRIANLGKLQSAYRDSYQILCKCLGRVCMQLVSHDRSE